MKLIDGYAVPDLDECCYDAARTEVADLSVSLAFCKQKRTVFQAGGNFGIYPLELAKHFDTVYTVEPDMDNYRALKQNIANSTKIIPMRAGLGSRDGRAAMDRKEPTNCGAHMIKQGDEFDIITIDSYNLTDCDFIQLDIEGSEHDALMGAIDTIELTHPVITLEMKGLGERYGYTDQDTMNLLASLGYAVAGRVNRDVIFTYG
jgi:FkbM family methyltransferase